MLSSMCQRVGGKQAAQGLCSTEGARQLYPAKPLPKPFAKHSDPPARKSETAAWVSALGKQVRQYLWHMDNAGPLHRRHREYD